MVLAMKRLIGLTVFGCVGVFGGVLVQAEERPRDVLDQPSRLQMSPEKVEAKVVAIRQLARKIDADPSLKKVVLKAGGRASFDPQLTRFTSEDGEVKKLEVRVKGDRGITREAYYFDQGALFLIKAEDDFWTFEGVVKPGVDTSATPKVTIVSRLRYYYAGGQCIRVAEKEAEGKLGDGVKGQLKKVKTETLEMGPAAMMYQQQSSLVRQIKTEADLKGYLEKRFKGE